MKKIPNRKKIYNEQFNLCEAKTILDDIIKFMNSQANNNLQVTMPLQKNLINILLVN